MANTRAKIKTSHDYSDHQSSHSAALIGSNDDLLTEILLWLPVISILRFKCVSKHFQSLLSHTAFTLRYDHIHFIPKSLGLFGNNNIYAPFNDEDRTVPPFRNLEFFSDPNGIRIIQSCNGLLLCCTDFGFGCDYNYYVFNPTTKQVVIVPSVPGGKAVWKRVCFMGLAFCRTDCVRYNVVCILSLEENQPVWDEVDEEKLFQIQTYSSETREWKVSVESFSARTPVFGSGVYWNGGICWTVSDGSYMCFKVDDAECQLLSLPVETVSYEKVTRYLRESGGYLHLIVHNEDNLLPLKVYEMVMDCSGWFLKYEVEIDGLQELKGAPMDTFPDLTVIDVVRGKKDEDTFMVLLMYCLYITYNVHDRSFKLISKLNNDYEGSSHSYNKFHRYSQTLAYF